MSYQQHPTPPVSQWAKLCALLITALATAAASLAAIAVSQPATAQITPLDPALCASTYRAASGHGALTEADCRTIVAWRNAVVSHPNSDIGPTHPMALWGTGGQTAFNTWNRLFFKTVNAQTVVYKITMRFLDLAGPLPGALPHAEHIDLEANLLTGGLPTWIYNAQQLSWLDLRSNRLSGAIAGSAFNAPKLASFLVQHNNFSGPVPDFNWTRVPKLIDLRLSNNNFSGKIPASWKGLVDLNIGIQRLQVAKNQITGDLPNWVANLKMANSIPSWLGVGPRRTYYVDFRSNRLCIPSNFGVPNYKKLNGSDAIVQAFFGHNACPTGQPAGTVNSVPENVRFEPVDATGNPTSDNPVNLKITWDRPSGITGPLNYNVKLHLTVPINDNKGRYCLGENFNGRSVANNNDQTVEITLTRANCTITNPAILFDPTKYTVSVSTLTISGGTEIAGDNGVSTAWGVYMADDAQKTYRDVANVMGLDYTGNIWLWDAENQVWQERNQQRQDFASLNLEPGSALAMQKRAPASWLPLAGLSTADADTPVTLQNGWNVLSAGGSASRGANEDGAFFIDDSLIDCSSTQGVIAILRHIPNTQRFDIELPCHPSREAAITQTPSFGPIQEINALDTLFVYFQSTLPVAVNWDSTNSKYIPAN